MPCLRACVLITSYLPLHRLALTCQQDSTKHCIDATHPRASIYPTMDRLKSAPPFLFCFSSFSFLLVLVCFLSRSSCSPLLFFCSKLRFYIYPRAMLLQALHVCCTRLIPWPPAPFRHTHIRRQRRTVQARAVLGSMEVLFPY